MSGNIENGTPITTTMKHYSSENGTEIHLEFIDDAHKGNILSGLNKMRKNRHFCDVVLQVADKEVYAHRAVLASTSPYLLELFSKDQNQKATENIIIYRLNEGIDKNALEILIDYCYTAKLDIKFDQVKAVFFAANYLKMETVFQICGKFLIKHLSVDNCIEIRSLPGIAKNKQFIQLVDTFIAEKFETVSKNNNLLNLYCVRIEVLHRSREEMSLVNHNSLSRLALDWIRKQFMDESLNSETLSDKTFMLYVAVDNSLQDCVSLPTGDISDTAIVQDYKKLSMKDSLGNKTKRKVISQPIKPRILIYNREIGEDTKLDVESDWNVIASEKVGEYNFLSLVTLGGKLSILSIQLRLNAPSSPTLSQSSESNQFSDEEKPDFYWALATMSYQRCAAGCGNYQNTLIVCGGYDRTECLNTVEQYIPETNTWIVLPMMHERRGRSKICVYDNKIYAFGGSNGTTELDSMEMLNFDTNKWVKMPNMPLARSNMGVNLLDNLIYIVGGWNGQAGIKRCDVYNPVSCQWTSIASLNVGRYQAGVATYNNLVYAIGGCDGWNCLNSVEIYHPNDNVWIMSKSIITARRGCGVAVFNNKLYVIGGSDGTHSLKSTEIFDEENQCWTVGPNMTTPRANVDVAVVGDRLYAVGGFSGKNFLNTIEYLDVNSNEWTTFIPKETCDVLARRKSRNSNRLRSSELNSNGNDIINDNTEISEDHDNLRNKYM